MSFDVRVAGVEALSVTVYIPSRGPWWVDAIVRAEDLPLPSGQVVMEIAGTRWNCTFASQNSGNFATLGRHRLVGGGAGWAQLLSPRSYHNDFGVLAKTVAVDAARECGELIDEDAFAPEYDRVGVDYVRRATHASATLERVIGARSWWVGRDGLTRVGDRDEGALLGRDTYEVMHYDPRSRLAEIAMDDVGSIDIGSKIQIDDDTTLTIAELRMEFDADAARISAWGGELSGRGRMAHLMGALLSRHQSAAIYGKYRYRVVKMATGRVELQAVSAASGLPDVIPVSIVPGVAGAKMDLAPSSIVLVEFVEGDPTKPIVTAFEDQTPTGLSFSVAATLRLGSSSASQGAILGTSHKLWADTHTHTGVQTGGGTSGPPSSPSPALSSKVFVS